MDKVAYCKQTFFKLFKWNFFTKTEIYNELSGENLEPIQLNITQDYYNKEFDIDGGKGTPKTDN